MIHNTKILRGSLSEISLGKKYLTEMYLAFCHQKNNPEGDSFISSTSYESVLSELKQIHLGQDPEDTGASFILEGFWSRIEEHKYVIHLQDGYYHLIIDTLATILKIYEEDPDAIFIICTGTLDPYFEKNAQKTDFLKAVEFVAAILSRNQIPFLLLETYHEITNYRLFNGASNLQQALGEFKERATYSSGVHPIYKFSNVTIVPSSLSPVGLTLRDLTLLIDKYVMPKINRKPSKPVIAIYISRGGISSGADSAFKDPSNVESGYVNNHRLYNEQALEEYLATKGFHILRSDDFNTIEEQIAFVNSAKLIIGATGTGLINTLFMNSNQTVIELRAEMMFNHRNGAPTTIEDYINLSYARGHQYIGLDVSDKQGDTAIAKLEKLFKMLDVEAL